MAISEKETRAFLEIRAAVELIAKAIARAENVLDTPDIKQLKGKLAQITVNAFSQIEQELKKIDPDANLFDPNLPEEKLRHAIDNAIIKARGENFIQAQEQENKQRPRISDSLIKIMPRMTEHIENIIFPTGKEMGIFANITPEDLDENGEISFSTNNKYPQTGIICGLDFDTPPDGVTFSKVLAPHDRRIHDAIATLWDAWEHGDKETPPIFTYHQLHRALGGRSKPSPTQIKNYDSSLIKFRIVQARISNETELTVPNNKYPEINYTGSLLATAQIKVTYNGQEANAFKILDKPILLTIGEQRGHISRVPITAYQVPYNSSDMNDSIFDYLLRRIVEIKHNPRKPRLLFSSIFDACKIPDDRRYIARAKNMIKRCFAHWKKCEFIRDYVIDEAGISVKLPPKTPLKRSAPSKNQGDKL